MKVWKATSSPWWEVEAMRKLIAANFARLRKEKIFWCILVTVAGLSLINIFNSARSYKVMMESGYIMTLDDYYFNQAPLMGIFIALFSSLYLGTEYSDGVLRNKLIIGHKRQHIYYANFAICSVAALSILTVWLVIGALGFYLIGPMEMGVTGYLGYMAVSIGFAISSVALFTLVGSLSTNKAMTIVYSAVLFIVLAITASGLYDRLCEPEFNEGMMYINGQFVTQEPTANPLYLSGADRLICQSALELIPNGQALLLSDVAIENPFRAILFSVVFTIGVLTLGCYLFRRKDIK